MQARPPIEACACLTPITRVPRPQNTHSPWSAIACFSSPKGQNNIFHTKEELIIKHIQSPIFAPLFIPGPASGPSTPIFYWSICTFFTGFTPKTFVTTRTMRQPRNDIRKLLRNAYTYAHTHTYARKSAKHLVISTKSSTFAAEFINNIKSNFINSFIINQLSVWQILRM